MAAAVTRRCASITPRACEQPLDTQLELEARAIARCAKTEDSWNAIQAVLAREKPEFRGF